MLDIIACFIELRLLNAKPLLASAINEGVVVWNLPPFSFSSTRCCRDGFWVILYTSWLKKKDLLILVVYFSLTGKTRTIA